MCPRFLLFVVLTLASPLAVRADSPPATPALPLEKSQPVRVPRFEQPPSIDGRLDEDVWKNAAVLKDFYQTNPGDNIAPSQQTEVLVGYDSKAIYFAFRAHDEDGKVRATVPKRDQIFEDDYVGFYLDTYDDRRKAYQMFFNPVGVQADGIFTEGLGEDFSVDVLMESKGRVGEDGFVVEIAIPFKSLRYEAGPGKNWGVHFFRRIKRLNNELSSWMPNSRENSSTLNQAGHITGLEGIETDHVLEIIPSLTISESGERVAGPKPGVPLDPFLAVPDHFVNRPIHTEAGLTIKYGITPAVTLDMAVNPDFAQVEADATVVTANQRFPIFFEEKRPFFLEGVDLFKTELTVVHTRAIVDPDVAVKLTGKVERNSFGLLLASDNAPGNFSEEERNNPDLFPFIEPFLDKNAYIGVVRLKRDVGKENSLGFLGTTYNFIENHNHIGGFDGRFRFNPTTTFVFQVIGTTSRAVFYDPDRDVNELRTGNGLGYLGRLERFDRHFGFQLQSFGRSSNFRSDVGFIRRLNANDHSVFLRYSSEPDPKATLINWRVSSFNNAVHNWQGLMQDVNHNAEVGLNFARQTFVGAGYNLGYSRIFEEEFGPRRNENQEGAFFGEQGERTTYPKNVFAFVESTPSKAYSLFFFTGYTRQAFDYDFGGGPRYPRVSPPALANPFSPLDPGPGRSFSIESSFLYKPTDALRASIAYNKSRLVRDDTGQTAFDENIFSLRSTYQFTRFIFARARVDYSTLASNVRGQFLVGWTPNPGTAFYAGYNDDLNYNGFNPFTGDLQQGFSRNNRVFFIKMSYLFRTEI